ncbi:Nucleotidyltransferase domain-containing protein [Tindallia magadiensis]|uniref:Nucleotidyltransferase domain-containing protein n=1 Tax=Tindallia magadiensis TaxID=69895 RepID=A0A1I3C6R1_9FIRM|nr:nucleotidyltransferase domain-containing protein [Tindallia magadiensis]SFH70244.1 Nucleotidyltransferase domain-containing protein [Tindallia magadiensis]
MHGLTKRDMEYILEAVKKHPEIKEVILYGSRAMGNHKKGSDVDLALVGEEVTQKVLRKVYDDLNEELPLPYFFDVLIYHEITNQELKKHIDNLGKSIYKA